MQSSQIVRTIAAAASIVLVALALMGASWYADSARQAALRQWWACPPAST